MQVRGRKCHSQPGRYTYLVLSRYLGPSLRNNDYWYCYNPILNSVIILSEKELSTLDLKIANFTFKNKQDWDRVNNMRVK